MQAANDRLWSGIHPDGLAAVYDEHPSVISAVASTNRSEVLNADDPLRAMQEVH